MKEIDQIIVGFNKITFDKQCNFDNNLINKIIYKDSDNMHEYRYQKKVILIFFEPLTAQEKNRR